MYDVAVVGGGLIGSPAARILAEQGQRVALIAPPEPPESLVHDGVFGAHYDVSRLAWLHDPDPVEEWLARSAHPAMVDLDRRHGGILSPAEFLFASAPGRDEGMFTFLSGREGLDALDADGLSRRFPDLRFPADVVGYADPAGPGLLDPRRLVAVEQEEARSLGADVVPEIAERVGTGPPFELLLGSGDRLRAQRVLIAAGAFSNRAGLLDRPLALRFKQESVAVAQLDGRQAASLGGLPAMSYNLASDAVAEVYAAPPVRYPDGTWGLKWGANTTADEWVTDIESIKAWYRAGSEEGGQAIRSELMRHVPGLEPVGWAHHRCVVTYTTHGRPYIGDAGADGVFVAVGGNGRSAKSSTALGRLAAGAVTGAWPPAAQPGDFAPRFADEAISWVGRDLWSERRAI